MSTSAPPLGMLSGSLVAAAQQRRRRALMLFAGLSTVCGISRSAPMLYFFRTGYACAQPPTSEAGDEGWSGSEYCGDPHSVIGAAQKLSSTLLPIQLCVELIATPVFSALADNWNYRGVVAIGAVLNVVGIGLLGLTWLTRSLGWKGNGMV